MKSLIKPPPPRNSWELLLDDYLKHSNVKTNLPFELSPNSPPLKQQSTNPLSQPVSPNLFHETFLPSSYYQYPQYSSYAPYEISSCLPPRRYKMTLDELVHLISQVGRSDLYREMVQYVKAQQTSTSTHANTNSSNINTYSKRRRRRTTTTTEPFL
ncbi:unnamed protein product [Rotaria magnacalcarata]|uniref:Uncharacterized protein n=1 Tax=Rotaria magnacalcarata TaxID=392030 RepID=A0A816AX74_9BILA|nr:unnamed protein product [Rotaria magnacalcarata]CAF1603817.1 unnamed protein product [Rotaria magnacalcarata]CAF5145604.1 unnamed protein product [Rotaria magnacalcarata]CAF5216120.1 unnamed protein product [Rotaria magnacalcarata]